jgi:hypothetical protein
VFADFYSTFATVSLTVTGLWMYVASARFREWMVDRDHFRRASAVSVQLAFPGIMCLFALIEPDSSALWRFSFGLTSAVAVALMAGLNQQSTGRWPRANVVGTGIAAVLFVAIALVAAFPSAVDDLMSAAPRRLEFFLFCLLLIDGLVVAWMMLFDEELAPRS